MKTLCAIMIFLSCASCALMKPKTIAYNCPHLILPKDPPEYLNKLTDKSPPSDVLRAWIVTAISYKDWNLAVRRQVSASK